MLLSSILPHNFPTNFPMNFSGKLTSKIVIKDDRIRKDGTCTLYLQVFLNGIKKKLPINISVCPDNFDKIKQRVKPKTPFANDYNLIIEKSLADINKIEINYRLSNVVLTIEKLVEEFQNPSSRIDFCQFWLKEMERQELILKKDTYRQQMTVLNKLMEYKKVIYFYEIDESLIEKINVWLKKTKKNNDNTIASFWKSFKKYLHIANSRGIITPILHDDVKRGEFKSDRVFLMPNELRKLHEYFNSEFIIATHKAILARFMFSCFTGLRISDIKNLTVDNFYGDMLFLKTVKTDKIQKIKLNKSALLFIAEDCVFYGDFTNEYINRELKFIMKACKINKNVSFHISRHTFATNYLLSGGNVVNLQKLMGHSKIEETMIYVHIVESLQEKEIMSMDEILEKKPIE